MLLGAYSVLNKNPGRGLGGSTVSDSPSQWGKSGPARGRFMSEGADYLSTSATPNTYQPPYCWVLPKSDGASTLSGVASFAGSCSVASGIVGEAAAASGLSGSGSLAGAMSLLVNAVAALSGTGTISSADMSLVLLAVAALSGSSSISADISAQATASSAISGTGAISAAALGAVSAAIAALSGSGSASGAIVATGELAADVSPFTTLSPENLATAVWDALAVASNEPGTMGEVLNAAGGGSSPSQVAAAVWDALRSTSQDTGSMGEALVELFELMGLDPTKPLVVTATTRDAGAGISQTIADASGTVTVTRV